MNGKFILKSCLLLVTATSLASCGGRGGGTTTIDKTKSQLYVGVWDGGYRNNWVTTWGKKFSEKYANKSFEPGKMGVEVIANLSKDYLDDTLAYKIKDEVDEICFAEQGNYYVMKNAGSVYNVSEWVTTPLTEFGESKSIEDKMSKLDKEYYGSGVSEYYGIPWYVSFNPINYDINLFEENNFYYAAEGYGEDGWVDSPTCPKSNGPDGKAGTMDDGLPATYDDFFKLCDRMVDAGIVPFVWAGGMQSYVNSFMQQLAADYEGYDNFSLNYTFNGTADNIVKSIKEGVAEVEQKLITNQNGYLTKQEAGWYYGLKFLERLITTTKEDGITPKYYNKSDCFSETFSHLNAQTKFLRSNYTASLDPIAMLIDGTWWYNEATETFDAMSGIGGCSKQTRRIGIMVAPKVSEAQIGDPTLMQSWISSVYVRSNIDQNKVELIREFYRFIHTDECLTSYMYDSCGIRPFKFDLVGKTLSDFPVYTQQQYTLYQSYKCVTPYANNNIMKQFLNNIHKNYTSVYGGTSYNLVTKAFRDGLTAENYFAGMGNYWNETEWQKYIKAF